MPKRSAAHRGGYRRPTTQMPPLLRRALAQLRGDSPDSVPSIGEAYSTHYPFPMTLKMLGVDHPLNDPAPRTDLLAMLARLERADIGRAWNIFNQRCAAIECDPGGTMLFILINAVSPVHALSAADRAKKHRSVSTEAMILLEKIEAILSTGASLDGLTLPNAAECEAFFATHERKCWLFGSPLGTPNSRKQMVAHWGLCRSSSCGASWNPDRGSHRQRGDRGAPHARGDCEGRQAQRSARFPRAPSRGDKEAELTRPKPG